MNTILFFSLMALASAYSIRTFSNTAQKREQMPNYSYPPELMDELRRLQQAALASDYAFKQTAHLANNISPRLSGSLQAGHAVQYVAEEMRNMGLHVKLQKTMVSHWVRGAEAGELTQFPGMASGIRQKIVLTALGGSVATPPEGLTTQVIVVNNFDELNALGQEEVRGKIVLFNTKFDEQLRAQGYGLEAYRQSVIYRSGGAWGTGPPGASGGAGPLAGRGG